MIKLEKEKWFKYLVQILFYGSSLCGFIFLYYKNWYVLPAIFLFWVLFITIPYNYFFKKEGIVDAFNDFINLIDDPIDDFKHRLHGMKIFGYTIRLPKWLMRGSGDPTK